MALFWLLLFIAIDSSLAGQGPDSDYYNQQMLNVGLKKGGDGAEQLESLLEALLLEECEIVKNIQISAANILDKDELTIRAEVERNCAALTSGKPLNRENLATTEKNVTSALQKYGQEMVAYLKGIEEKQITVDEKQFVAPFNILRQIVKEMSAGPAKDAIQAVLKPNSVPVPSKMLQFVIDYWHIHSKNAHGHPQKRREHPRRRRKRESWLVNGLAFVVIWFITSTLIINSVKSALGSINECFEGYFYRIVIILATILFFLFQNAQNDQGQSFQRAIRSLLSKFKNRRRY